MNHILLSIILLTSTLLYAQSAPLGLTWGMDISLFNCLEKTTTGNLTQCKISNPPKPIPNAVSYYIAFDENMGLQQVLILANEIKNDYDGSKGIEIYKEYVTMLSKKYGNPVHHTEITGLKLYTENDGFYQCLAYDGCGMYASIFSADSVKAVISIEGFHRGEGILRIAIEGPQWHNAFNILKNNQSKEIEDAL